jgi:hypothetical protein
MKGFNFGAALGRASPGSCKRGARAAPRAFRQARQYSTRTTEIPKSKIRGRVLLATAAAAGVGSYVFADDVKHAYKGAERSGRVLVNLAVCINE